MRRVVLAVLFSLLVAGCDRQQQQTLPLTELTPPAQCDLTGGCAVSAPAISLELQMGPALQALRPFPLRIRFTAGEPVTAVTASFSMKDMDMGLNRYRLQEEDGEWRADVTLPVCVSGRSDWIAAFEITTAQHLYTLKVPFVLGK